MKRARLPGNNQGNDYKRVPYDLNLKLLTYEINKITSLSNLLYFDRGRKKSLFLKAQN